jgi:hypothetical protein
MEPTQWERLKRWWCRRVGHRWQPDGRGQPVVAIFDVCLRCRAWRRDVVRREFR